MSPDTPIYATSDPHADHHHTPRWRFAIRCALVVVSAVFVLLLGLEVAHITLGAAGLPKVFQDLARASFAVLLVSVIADLTFSRTLHAHAQTVRADIAVMRHELADTRTENAELRQQVRGMTALLARMENAITTQLAEAEIRRATDIAALHQAIADNAAQGWYAGYAQAAKDDLRDTDGDNVARLPGPRSTQNDKWPTIRGPRNTDEPAFLRRPSSH